LFVLIGSNLLLSFRFDLPPKLRSLRRKTSATARIADECRNG
jgi:hypothetical protein